MKILHINTNYTNNPLHQNMIKSLMSKGVYSDVVIPAYSNDSVVELHEHEEIAKCFRKFDRINYYAKQKKIFSYLDRNYDIREYDCIHAYTVFTDGNIAYRMKQKYDIPYVVAVRNTDINTFFKYMFHLRKRGVEILKNASKVVFLSQAYKNRLFSGYLTSDDAEEIEKKSCVIPNGADSFWLENSVKEKMLSDNMRLNICFAGKIDKNKNCRLTVDACKELISRGYDINYTLVGTILDKNFERVVAENSFITHIPFLNKEDLINVYRKNDIFVMPSLKESFGMVYVEAMCQGLPVIYTKDEGFDKQFYEGEVGFHTSPYDSTQLADVMVKVVKDYNNISKRCIECSQRFDWDKITQRYIEIYSEILNSRNI